MGGRQVDREGLVRSWMKYMSTVTRAIEDELCKHLQCISENAQRENCHCKGIAAISRVSTEDVRDEFVSIL